MELLAPTAFTSTTTVNMLPTTDTMVDMDTETMAVTDMDMDMGMDMVMGMGTVVDMVKADIQYFKENDKLQHSHTIVIYYSIV